MSCGHTDLVSFYTWTASHPRDLAAIEKKRLCREILPDVGDNPMGDHICELRKGITS